MHASEMRTRPYGGLSVRAVLAALHGLGAVVEMLLARLDRSGEHRVLQALDDRLLKDIGISRADVEHEVSRRPMAHDTRPPFWYM